MESTDEWMGQRNVATAAGIQALLRGVHEAHPVARMCGSSRLSGGGRGTPTATSIAETSSSVSPTPGDIRLHP